MTQAGRAESAREMSAAAVAEVLALLGDREHRGVVVDSPPGAGKSTLVVRAARELAAAGEPLIVVAQTNNQVDDLVDRLAEAAPELAIGRLSGQGYVPPGRVSRHARVAVDQQVRDAGRLPGDRGHRREVGHGQRGALALGHRGRGLPDALGHAAADRRPVQPGPVRR